MNLKDNPLIAHRDLLLLVVGLRADRRTDGSIGGMTRLQKFLFLLEREEKITLGQNGFEFIPYDAGPYSSRLYDDLEFLENLGFITSEVTSEIIEEEKPDADALTDQIMFPDFGELIGENQRASDNYEEKRFCLTTRGEERIKKLLTNPGSESFAAAIARVKERYSGYSLTDLLYYVYTKYPEMATQSTIREKVLSRGGRHGAR